MRSLRLPPCALACRRRARQDLLDPGRGDLQVAVEVTRRRELQSAGRDREQIALLQSSCAHFDPAVGLLNFPKPFGPGFRRKILQADSRVSASKSNGWVASGCRPVRSRPRARSPHRSPDFPSPCRTRSGHASSAYRREDAIRLVAAASVHRHLVGGEGHALRIARRAAQAHLRERPVRGHLRPGPRSAMETGPSISAISKVG